MRSTPETRRLPALSLLVALLAACSNGGSSGQGAAAGDLPPDEPAPPAETRVLVYGDSLWDKNKDPSTCDLCSAFPDDIVVHNYAIAATRLVSDRRCDGFYEGLPAIPDPECLHGADRALRFSVDPDPRHYTCFASQTGLPTCVEDNPDNDVLLIQFGTNDVRSRPYDDPWDARADVYASWLEEILWTRPPGMACVLVIPPPIWSENFDTFNARLEIVASILDDAALRHGCEIADLLGLYLDIEAIEGEGATLPLYEACPGRGSPDGDCVHWSNPPPLEAVDEIVAAIDRAVEG